MHAFGVVAVIAGVGFGALSVGAMEGDWVDNPYEIATLPFFGSGTTCGYIDDIDFSCPTTSPAPDVVYRFIPLRSGQITVDLCGSGYDTQCFIVDEEFELIACNDDYYSAGPCGEWVSRLEDVQVVAGETYFIFVDGYFMECGAYDLSVYWHPTCELLGHPFDDLEGEEGPYFGYVDTYNGGCAAGGSPVVIQDIFGNENGDLVLSASSGWSGAGSADEDWFRGTGSRESFQVDVEAEQPMWLVVTMLTECESEEAWPEEFVESCDQQHFVLDGVAAGREVWLRFRPVSLYPPFLGWQFRYFASFRGLADEGVNTESKTWGGVKALFHDATR